MNAKLLPNYIIDANSGRKIEFDLFFFTQTLYNHKC